MERFVAPPHPTWYHDHLIKKNPENTAVPIYNQKGSSTKKLQTSQTSQNYTVIDAETCTIYGYR